MPCASFSSAPIVFVSDAFVDELPYGGAELTTEALIEASPVPIHRLRTVEISPSMIDEGRNKFWIFGNIFELNIGFYSQIAAALRYSMIEMDYKYCRHRSPELCQELHGTPCRCEHSLRGEALLHFFAAAETLWWMSEEQMKRYHSLTTLLSLTENIVLSSVFSPSTLSLLRELRTAHEGKPRRGWLVIGSPSWLKAAEENEAWCRAQGLAYEVLWKVPYHELLEKLARAEGLVFRPKGADSCPRIAIEAKLLGCKLAVNDFIQHAQESWFATSDLAVTESYLAAAPRRFWERTMRDAAGGIPAARCS